MHMRADMIGLITRILAVLSLLIGLGDAAGVLGVGANAVSPYQTLGNIGFTILTVLCIARLFAAVGLWIGMQWGALVLVASLAIELSLHLAGTGWIALSLWGFIFKSTTLLATIGLLGFFQIMARRQIAD